jgi:hypothetical protein
MFSLHFLKFSPNYNKPSKHTEKLPATQIMCKTTPSLLHPEKKKKKGRNGLLVQEFSIKLLLKPFPRLGFCCQHNIIQKSPLRKLFRYKSMICFKLFSSFLLFLQQTVDNSLPQIPIISNDFCIL